MHISTGNGYKIIIDEKNADIVGEQIWTGYRMKNKQGRVYVYVGRRSGPGQNASKMYLHRLIAARMFPNMNIRHFVVDHINGDTLDNRESNLRLATASVNRLNSGPQSDNTSGCRGVSWNSARRQWVARLRIHKQETFLGYFDHVEDAAKAVGDATRGLIGETVPASRPDLSRRVGDKPERAFLTNNNSSGYRGVSWNKAKQKWVSSLFKDGKRHFGGYFDTPQDAARAYNTKAKELYGEFAKVNEVPNA